MLSLNILYLIFKISWKGHKMYSKLLSNLSQTYGISEAIIEQHILAVMLKMHELITVNKLGNKIDRQLIEMLYKDAVLLVDEEKTIMNKMISANSNNIKNIVINSTKRLINKLATNSIQ